MQCSSIIHSQCRIQKSELDLPSDLICFRYRESWGRLIISSSLLDLLLIYSETLI